MTISLLPEANIVWLFAAAYIVFMMASSMEYPTMDALIIDSTNHENRKAIYTADYWLVNLSMAIGTALGGLFYVSHQIGLFMILTVVSAGILIVYWLWLGEINRVMQAQRHRNMLVDALQNYKIALQDGPFVRVVVGSMLIIAAELSLNSYIAVRLGESFKPLYWGNFEIGGIRMLSILNVENMLLVVLLTFFVSRVTDRFSAKKMLLIGLLVYGVGYTVTMSANLWHLLIFFNLIATLGEMMYSPIVNAEQANMMPEDKRGSYAAFANLGYTGGDLVARSTIIIGAFLMPIQMSIYIAVVILGGIFLIYTGFSREQGRVKHALI